jgi:hypothetical protein
MTLDELLQRKLAEWRPDSAGQTLHIDHPASGWKAAVSAERVETLGCRLREVVLTRSAPLAAVGTLADQASRIADRVTGLLEPLRLVEVDVEHGLAQLRSDSPARRGESVQYYEVLRHADGTTRLGRFEAQPGTADKRNPIPFTLTHEALAQVVAGLASA